MLSEEQLTHLEAIIQSINQALHVEEAALEAERTLRLVLCNDTVCFRPLSLATPEVDLDAALAGQPAAQQALRRCLSSVLHNLA